jgi:hypothetical protein
MKRLAVLLALAPSALAADEVHLRGGGRLSGVVLERTAESVLVEVGPGQIRLPMIRVERIVVGPSALALYRTRAAALAADDVNGWVRLARWAEAQGLLTQAREAYQRVLDLDPGNAAAHQSLGDVLLDGQWVSMDESYRMKGFVLFEGAWMRPEERQALLAERAAETAERHARVEAEARAREAEARARAAEAEARRAEAAAAAGSQPAGIPFGVFGPAFGSFGAFGGFGFGGLPPVVVVRPRHTPTVHVAVEPRMKPQPPLPH